ncbi:hypothetical protein GIV19_19760 [Pseudomonas syringae]|uniref:hypothetical protein n=1 Tax=Pseudomonas syringae TaxID=317 RepID=UPI001F18DB5F|nr:hypothetical protein [Pseudomonas syringae]MCF5709501.1 hypothetical protein [Pseudomonas syringae]
MQSECEENSRPNETEHRSICLFMMWEPHRQSLVDSHLFYVRQAEKKLLSQFENMEEEAEQASQDWLANNAHRFNPDRDDPGSFEEDAYHEGVGFYLLLSELRNQTILSLIAGIFHGWDKELRSWIAKEVHHWHLGDAVQAKIWSANFDQVVEFVSDFRLSPPDAEYLRTLSACRYVVNVYKHGKGSSLQKLKKNHPEFFPRLDDQHFPNDLNLDLTDHTDLKVTVEHFRRFSGAIMDFWNAIPHQVDDTEVDTVPDWLGEAIERDRKTELQKAGKHKK